MTGCGKEPPRRRANASCDKDTEIDLDAPYYVEVSYWYSSRVDDPSQVPTDLEPDKVMEFAWKDPQKCIVWWREVDGQDEMRMNVANAFSLAFPKQGEVKLAFAQNGWVCCEEFERGGVVKELFNDRLILDETTGQRDDPLYGAVTAYRIPSAER